MIVAGVPEMKARAVMAAEIVNVMALLKVMAKEVALTAKLVAI